MVARRKSNRWNDVTLASRRHAVAVVFQELETLRDARAVIAAAQANTETGYKHSFSGSCEENGDRDQEGRANKSAPFDLCSMSL